jgi:hypothetical protein
MALRKTAAAKPADRKPHNIDHAAPTPQPSDGVARENREAWGLPRFCPVSPKIPFFCPAVDTR